MNAHGIVVTGASSGIGRQIAIRLAQQAIAHQDRVSVLVHYCQNVGGANQTAEQIQKLGASVDIVAADLADPAAAARLAHDALERLPGLQTWVNNAGGDVLTGDASKWSFEAKVKWLLDVDLVGAMTVSRIVGPILADRRRDNLLSDIPSMIFIGWDQACRGMEGDAGMMFGPVKAAVMAFAASLAQTLAPEVRVNTVAPGWIQTAWGEATQGYWDKRARGQSLMHRWGKPEDVAAAVAYLCGRDAGFVTGQTIEVNGGWNRRYIEGR